MREEETDKELVARVKQGDRAAFDLLFARYQQKICSLVAHHIRDPGEVEDVAQEAFIKAFRALPKFRGESTFYTWLYRIAINTAHNHQIAKSRRPPDVDIAAEDAQFMGGADRLMESETPDAAASRDELAQAIEQAVAALPRDLRIALALREFEGLSYERIAAIMECPVGTVRSRIFRAREAVEHRIGHLLDR